MKKSWIVYATIKIMHSVVSQCIHILIRKYRISLLLSLKNMVAAQGKRKQKIYFLRLHLFKRMPGAVDPGNHVFSGYFFDT